MYPDDIVEVLDEYDRQKLNNQKADNRRKREEEKRKAEQAIQNNTRNQYCSTARRRRNPVKQMKTSQGIQTLSLAATPVIPRSSADDSLQSLVNKTTKQFKDMGLHKKPVRHVCTYYYMFSQ